MSTKIENVVYRASKCDEIFTNFENVSFSTPTPGFNSCTERMFNFAQFFSVFLGMVVPLAGGDMLHFVWLILMALCGWAAGEILGGKGLGRVADMLLGIAGALLVRFSVEALRIDVNAINLLLFSIWGAAALPGSVRFLAKRLSRATTPLSSE